MSITGKPSERRPNLLFIMADQWRSTALGFLGQDPVVTPHLDTLASESLMLTDAVSNYPICSPCRAMLMTGQYPFVNGVPFNCNSATAPAGVGLRPDTVCWSDVLHEQGYRLGYIGKWHLQAPTDEDAIYGEGLREERVWDAYSPPDNRHGFDFWYSHGSCDDHLRPHYWTSDAPREQPTRVQAWSPEHETDIAAGFLREAGRRFHADGTPFALVMSYNPPHQPFDMLPQRRHEAYREHFGDLSPEELLTRPNVPWGTPEAEEAAEIAPLYFAAMTGVDEQIGRLLAELDAQHLARDTVVVFTSDHGMQLGSHGLMYKNVWFDESLLIPFLVRWPGRIAPRSDDLLLSSPDVGPTLLGLLGYGDQIPERMQGRDLSAVWRGEDGPRPDVALYFGPVGEQSETDRRGLRTDTRTFVMECHQDGRSVVYLYDLEKDPYQLDNVAEDRPGEVAALTERLYAELLSTGDPWWR